jgi:DICT domain-containing protein
LLPKQTLVRMSHAIEDECAARAERPVLIATFQHERFYRHAEQRYRDLARTAEVVVVLADFEERRDPSGGPVEVPIPHAEPLGREWTLLCDAPGYSACLSAWERLGQDSVADGERLFETIWTVEPDTVRTAVRIAADLLADTAQDVAERLEERLATGPGSNDDPLRLVAAVSSRMVAYVGNATAGDALPPPHG